MNEVFADTCGWANAFVNTEPHHAQAATLMAEWQQQNQHVVTTNYVLSELITLFARLGVPRSKGLDYIKTIRSAPWVKIIHITEKLDEEAWKLLADRWDKEWSLVDCASFVLMEARGLTEALTADRHFEQAHFIRLLK